MTRRTAVARSRPPREIELSIEELSLEGFAPSDRHAIGDALAVELERLLRESPLHLASTSQQKADGGERLNAGTIAFEPNAGPGKLGAQIAQAVHQGLNRREGGNRQ